MVSKSFIVPHRGESREHLWCIKNERTRLSWACGSTVRNESCRRLKMAVGLGLRLLYSTHYYQEILTFSIKGKRGRNREPDFKGCLASMFFSLELPVIP